jgi:hypothetical protein
MFRAAAALFARCWWIALLVPWVRAGPGCRGWCSILRRHYFPPSANSDRHRRWLNPGFIDAATLDVMAVCACASRDDSDQMSRVCPSRSE